MAHYFRINLVDAMGEANALHSLRMDGREDHLGKQLLTPFVLQG